MKKKNSTPASPSLAASQIHIETFLDMMLAERNAAPNTRAAYERDLLDAASFIEKKAKTDLAHTNENDLRTYIQSLSDFSPKTQARRLSSLRQFFRFLCSEGQRIEDPTRNIDPPKLGHSLPKYLSEQEVKNLFTQVAKSKGPEGSRLRTMLEILYASGLRVTELVTLPLNAILFDRKAIHIRGKGGKERVVPLGDPALKAIKEWLPERKEILEKINLTDKNKKKAPPTARNTNRINPALFLFPSPSAKEGHMTRQRFFQILKDLAIQAHLAPERLSPHVIRHAFATHLIEHGADLRSVQTMLGHADIATTQIYTHVAKDHLTRTLQKNHPLMQKKK